MQPAFPQALAAIGWRTVGGTVIREGVRGPRGGLLAPRRCLSAACRLASLCSARLFGRSSLWSCSPALRPSPSRRSSRAPLALPLYGVARVLRLAALVLVRGRRSLYAILRLVGRASRGWQPRNKKRPPSGPLLDLQVCRRPQQYGGRVSHYNGQPCFSAQRQRVAEG